MLPRGEISTLAPTTLDDKKAKQSLMSVRWSPTRAGSCPAQFDGGGDAGMESDEDTTCHSVTVTQAPVRLSSMEAATRTPEWSPMRTLEILSGSLAVRWRRRRQNGVRRGKKKSCPAGRLTEYE